MIGAFALSVHGALRASIDVDALLSVDSNNWGGWGARFGLPASARPCAAATLRILSSGCLVIRDTHGNQATSWEDLRGSIRDYSPARSSSVGRPTFRFVGREDFIALKCFAGGPQDILGAHFAYQGAGDHRPSAAPAVTRRFGRKTTDHLEQIVSRRLGSLTLMRS